MSRQPPLVVRWLLRLIPPPHRTYVVGDLYEEYADHVLPRRGRLVAAFWLLGQALRTVIAFLRYPRPRRRAPRWSGPRLSHAYRSWRRRPGFALLASATLGVGIGAVTSVFSAADWILFRPLPGVEDSDRLVTIEFRSPEGESAGMSFPNLRDLEAATPGLTDLAAHTALPVQVGSSDMSPVSLLAETVTGEYFALVGARPAAGRLLRPEDADGGGGPGEAVVVLSYDLWNRAFGLAADALGSTLKLNGTSFTVIGVAPPGFRGTNRMVDIDLWVGGAQYQALRHAPPGFDWSMSARDARVFHGVLGRRREGVDPATVEAQLRTGMRGLVAAYPDVNDLYSTCLATVFTGVGLRPADRERVASIVRVFTIIVLVTLLIACANVANLLVVRGMKRRGELAVRRALGESTVHLYSQHTLESLLLAVPAALLGLFIAEGLNAWFWGSGFLPTGPLPDIGIDWRVAGFAVSLAVLTALSFSLLPVIVGSRATIVSHVNASRTAPRRVAFLQGTFTVSQLALSLALLAGALVLTRTIVNLQRVDLGFSPEDLVVYQLDPGPQGYAQDQNIAFHQHVLSELRELPGVDASTAAYEPFGQVVNYVRVALREDESDRPFVLANWVADEYFRTLDIPVLEGSGFRAAPPEPVVILSRHTAHELFGDSRAVDRMVAVESYSAGSERRRVVGVVDDVVSGNPRGLESGTVYLPLSDAPVARAALLVHTTMPRRDLDRAVRAAVAGVDPNVPVPPADLMTARVEMSMASERSLARITGMLAVLACGLAGVGLYSVIAYATVERIREFGIRMALGATDGRIVQSVFLRALSFGVAGTVAGVMASIGLSRVIGSRVFGVTALDPASLGVAAGVLLVLSVVAAVVPAVSVVRVDPIRSLNVS